MTDWSQKKDNVNDNKCEGVIHGLKTLHTKVGKRSSIVTIFINKNSFIYYHKYSIFT
jgi:hypothetical protein